MANQRIFRIIILLLSLGLSACSKSTGDKLPPYEIDYSDPGNWVKLTQLPKHKADVFYLYPTSWAPVEGDGLINTIDNAVMRKRAPVIYSVQGSCFEEVANVYAPFYRQADAFSILPYPVETQVGVIATVPYDDAVAAFEYYLEHYNNGRPFILAGHSQGSALLKTFLAEYMKDHPDIYKRMIAAYTIGYSYEESYFFKNPHLKFAQGETDTHVVISWNCEFLKDGQFGKVNRVCAPGALSINPVTWKRDGVMAQADDSRNLGALTTRDRYSVQVMYDPLRKYEVLIIGGIDTAGNEGVIGDQAIHNRDYELFYYNITENAGKRIERYFSGR